MARSLAGSAPMLAHGPARRGARSAYDGRHGPDAGARTARPRRARAPAGCSPASTSGPWTSLAAALRVPALPARRGHLPRRRSGRLAVRRGERLGQDHGRAPRTGAEPAILTTIGPGGFFGELALLDGAPRSATAVAVDAVETLVLRRDAFDRLVDTEPGAPAGPAGDAGRRDPAADRPGRGPPLPGPAGPARAAPAPRDRRRRRARRRRARCGCRGRTRRASWRA